eukprot:jgi/Galph1/2396/GphlegSOOS_G1038.1
MELNCNYEITLEEPLPRSPPVSSVSRRRRHSYGDRFIPCRDGVDLLSAYCLLERSPKQVKKLAFLESCKDNVVSSHLERISTTPSSFSVEENESSTPYEDSEYQKEASNARIGDNKNDTSYHHVLKYELFGDVFNTSSSSWNQNDAYLSPDTSVSDLPVGSPQESVVPQKPSFGEVRHFKDLKQLNNSSKKLFRFKASSKGRPGGSPFTLSPISLEGMFSETSYTPNSSLQRKIPKNPYKVLDAPNLADDFYLNLVDWSSENILAVGLDRTVYLWNAVTSKVTKICEVDSGDAICSVSWSPRGKELAVGTRSGEVHLYDISHVKRVRTFAGHTLRVGCISWTERLVASGSRDHTIRVRDWRIPLESVMELRGHSQEVCGLRWSYDDHYLASGGNDNKLLIWKPGIGNTPIHRFEQHTAAVKAIAWSPHQSGLLVSGGGTADRCIRFWNTLSGTLLKTVDTGSQVCNIAWSRNVNEFVSTHGYSQNQIIVWKYPNLSKVATLTGHTYRVLYLATSPDGESIVSGAGDETLRFWTVFPGPRNKVDTHQWKSLLSSNRTCLR